MKALRKALQENEEWLMERVRDYALAQGYTRYTSTLVSAWKISIAGLSEALAQAMNQAPASLDFGPDDTFQVDPAARFAIKEAQLHRERGISLAMFLGLLKYYRQSYQDLVAERMPSADRKKARGIVARFFDRVELGVVLEWSACEKDAMVQGLQEANRNLTNEKNKYLTVFESLALPAFLFDADARLLQTNHAAVQWLRLRIPPGLEYYLEKAGAYGVDSAKNAVTASEILPDVAADIVRFCGQPGERIQVERTIHLGDEERFYIVSLGRQLDFSNKFAGVVVTLEGITARRVVEKALREKKERLSEAVRKRMRQLKSANKLLEKEISQRATLEDALRKGAQFYRAVVEDQEELVCRFTPDCVLTFVNRAYCRFFGQSEDRLLGKSFLPFIPDDLREALLEHLRAITPETPLRIMEHAAAAADQSVRWQRWTNRGFFDAQGNIVEYQAVGSDITDRYQAEEELWRLNAELELRVKERTQVAEDKAVRLEEEVAHRKTTEERLAHAYRLASIQGQVASAFVTTQDEEVYSNVLQVLREATNSEQGIFAYLDEDGAMVAPSLTRDAWSKCRIPDKTIRFPKDTWANSSCVWAQAIREKRLLVKNAPGSAPEGHVPITCALVAPILHADAVIGLFMLANRPGGYGQTEREIMEDTCQSIAPLLQAWLRQERTEAVRRQAEAELRENRAMLRQILDSVPQSIFWKDADSVFLGCNQVFAKACGLAGPEEIIGKTDYDVPWLRAEADAYRADDAEVVASKRPKLHIMEPLPQPDGSRLWIDTTKMPLLDAENNVRGVLGVFEDITEKKQAEEALRQSEELFRNLFERHTAVKLILDPDTGAILDANQAAATFYGWSCEQLRSMRIQDINTLPPEAVKKEMERVRARDRAYFEFRHRRADGSIRDVAVFSSKFEMKGKDILHSIIHDITQRKLAEEALRESEEKHRAMFESMTEGACILDAVRGDAGELVDYRIVDVNPAYSDIMGVSRERAVGALVRELYGLSQPPDREAYSRVLAQGTPAVFETSIPELDKHFHVSASRMGPDRFVAMFQDITQRKHAEEALRRSEAFQKAIIACTPLALYTIDREGRVKTWNDSAQRLFGWSAEEAIGAPLPILPDGKQDEHAQLRRRVLQGESLVGIELMRQRKDGARIDISLSAARVLDAEGNVLGILSAAQDITDRKRAEEALRRRLEMEQILAGVSGQLVGMRFEAMEKGLPPLLGLVAGSIGADLAQVCCLENEADTCLSSWNVEGESWEGIPFGSGVQGHPWILSKLRNFESLIVRSLKELPPEAAAERDCLAERGVRSLLAAPLTRGEALSGCLAFMTVHEPRDWPVEDVSLIETFARILANAIETARLERTLRYKERRYFDLIDNLAEGLLYVDREKRIQLVNKSMAGMLGYTAHEVLGSDPRDYLTEEGGRIFEQKFKERLEGKSGKHTFELLHKEGRRVYVSVSSVPVRDEHGEIVGVMSLISDLSQERLLQLQLIQAQRLEAIGQLAAGIAHEINTPTQYVDNNTQFLRGAFDDLLALVQEYEALLQEARAVPSLDETVRRVDDTKEERQTDAILADIPGALHDSSEGLQRISLIVDSVKRFAHPGQDAIQPAEINEALRSTIVVARNEWKYVAEVSTELDPDLPLVPCVLSDINQVVLNLIVNAAHAIAAVPDRPQGAKGLITLRTRTEEGWAVIEVQDTGTGIPATIRPRIFDPFFTTKEVGKGTGQGLAIARTVVAEKHRGSITFETEEGKGTTFFVRLPLKQSLEKSTR